MAVSIDWATKVINVPQADLTFVGGTLYEHDTNAFRLELKALEASAAGMPFDDTHRHNTEVVISSVVFSTTGTKVKFVSAVTFVSTVIFTVSLLNLISI